jgi:hypothetical protein
MKNHQNEINSTVDALQEFVKQFDANDDYTKLVIEILLEELFLSNKNLKNSIKSNMRQ